MDEKIEVWGIFHDGYIMGAKGELPNLSLRVEIEYLRNMFSGDGDSFWIHLKGCTHFEYINWENNKKRETKIDEIIKLEPEILYVSQIDKMTHIDCAFGELELIYDWISFEIDTGETVSIEELGKACDTYWNEFEKCGQSVEQRKL